MELWYFELNWKEFQIESRNRVILLVDMLKRSRGTCRINGCQAVNFEPMNEDVDAIFLRTINDQSGSYCLYWDDESEKWENLGRITYRNEWGLHHLKRNWQNCGIRFSGSNKTDRFSEIFSECLGDSNNGLLFVGKGKLDGEKFLIRLDVDTRLSGYYDDQRCEILNKETDEWEFWGMLIKKMK